MKFINCIFCKALSAVVKQYNILADKDSFVCSDCWQNGYWRSKIKAK